MSTYKQIFYHIVFSTKNRKPTISDMYCEELYKYIWGIINKRKCKLYRINGTKNHIHIFSDLHPSVCLADYVRDIKVNSGIWMKSTNHFPKFSSWQNGYAAFTYSIKEKDVLINYIKKQKSHHKEENFIDELKRILLENGVEFEEKYLL